MKKLLGVAITSLVLMSGCSTMQDVDTEQKTDFIMTKSLVEGKTFALTHLDEKELGDGLSATMIFEGDRLSGRGFCNLYSGSYEINFQNLFETSKLFSTRRSCDNKEVQAAESRFHRLLKEQMRFEETKFGYKVLSEEGSFEIMETLIVEK